MRALGLLLIVLLAAGCFGQEGTPPTPTPPTATTTPELTPTTPATPTPTPEVTPTPSPEPLPPKPIANETFDFSREGDPTGQSPKTHATQAVPEGYATLLVNITTARTSAGPTQLPVSGSVAAPSVTLVDPNGVEVYEETEENAQRALSFPAVPGAWSLVYRGAGTMTATVSIVAVG